MIYYFILFLLLILLFIFYCQKRIVKYHKPKISNIEKFDKLGTNKPSIITYNIQKFPWSIKGFANIKKLLEQYSIILLQECYDDTFSLLHTNFPDYYIYRDPLEGVNILSSGLVILSLYPITKYSSHNFKNYNPLTLDCFSQKGFIIANININGYDMCIINTHLQSSDHHKYDRYAILQLKEIIKYLEDIKQLFILGGDFNIDIVDLQSIFKNYFPSEWQFCYPKEPTIYFNLKSGYTQSHYKPGYEPFIFDYFITNIKNEIYVCDVKTIPNPYSDHNPVSCSLDFSNV